MVFTKYVLLFVVTIFELSVVIRADVCNPLQGTCSPIPGLANSTYYMDFTQQHSTPSDWILADYAVVNYGSNGANFTFEKRYDAPYIWSNFYVLFGHIEVVLKAAPGTGIVTGAVMMSDDLDEIDWEWSGNNFNSSSGKVQTNYFGKGITGYYDRGTQPSVTSPTEQFHTYALDWTPSSLVWSVDGKSIRTLTNNGATSGSYQYPQTPARLHLGIWDGGDPDSNSAVVQWAGGYTNFSQAPFTAYVKSVKITTPNPCSSWQYPTGFSGNWQDVKCTNVSITNAVVVVNTTTGLLSSSSTASASPTNLPCTYFVVSGDYGYAIASKLGVTFDSLATANPSVDWDELLLGQVLNIPGGICQISSNLISSSANSTSVISSSSSSSIPESPSSTMNLTVIPSPSSIATPSSTTAPQAIYTVKAGDYGYAIATSFGCTFDDLEAANPGVDWDKLLIGQNLNIPAGTLSSSSTATASSATSSSSSSSVSVAVLPIQSITSSSSTSSSITATATTTSSPTTSPSSCLTYIVAAGDTGYIIAQAFGIAFTDLEQTNPGVDWDKLLIGKVLNVPADAVQMPSSGLGSTICGAAQSTSIESLSSLSSATASAATETTYSDISASSSSTTISTPAAVIQTAPLSPPAPTQTTFLTPTTTTSKPPSSITPPSPSQTMATTSTTRTSVILSAKPTPSSSSSLSPTPKPLACNQDNCLRNVLDPKYSSSMLTFCPSYTRVSSSSLATPTWLTMCANNPSRVSSACSCLVTSFANAAKTSTSSAGMSKTVAAERRITKRGWRSKWLF